MVKIYFFLIFLLFFCSNVFAEKANKDYFSFDDLESALKNDGKLDSYQTKTVLKTFRNKFGENFKAKGMFMNSGAEFLKFGFPFGKPSEDLNYVLIKTIDDTNNIIAYPFNIMTEQNGIVGRLASYNFRLGFFVGKEKPDLKDLNEARFEGVDVGLTIPFKLLTRSNSRILKNAGNSVNNSVGGLASFIPGGPGIEIHYLKGVNRNYDIIIIEFILGASIVLAKDQVIFKAVDNKDKVFNKNLVGRSSYQQGLLKQKRAVSENFIEDIRQKYDDNGVEENSVPEDNQEENVTEKVVE